MTQSLMAYTIPSLWPSASLDEIIQGQLILQHLGNTQAFLIATSTLLEPSGETRKRLEQHPSCPPRSYRLPLPPPRTVLWELTSSPGQQALSAASLPSSAGSGSAMTIVVGKHLGMKDNWR